jgi:hypothetical protein
MARVNVYLPDDLAQELAEVEDLAISAVCQRALREELKVMQAIVEAGKDMERIEVDVVDRRGGIRTKAFTGRWLVDDVDEEDGVGFCSVALTGRGRIAVYSGHVKDEDWRLSVYDDLDDAEAAGESKEAIADARGALTGENPVVELDI